MTQSKAAPAEARTGAPTDEAGILAYAREFARTMPDIGRAVVEALVEQNARVLACLIELEARHADVLNLTAPMVAERHAARAWARRWKAAYRRERQRRRGDESGAMYGMAVFRQEWEQMRGALLAMRQAHYLTSVRLSGYDWNADPDKVTLAQGDAWALSEAALNAEPARPRVIAELIAARARAAEAERRAERAQGVVTAAGATSKTWERVCRCVDEFEPDDMTACGEWKDALDSTLMALCAAVAALRAEGGKE